MDKEKHEITRAERAALEAFPPDVVKTMHGEVDLNEAARAYFCRGYDKAIFAISPQSLRRAHRQGVLQGDVGKQPVGVCLRI